MVQDLEMVKVRWNLAKIFRTVLCSYVRVATILHLYLSSSLEIVIQARHETFFRDAADYWFYSHAMNARK